MRWWRHGDPLHVTRLVVRGSLAERLAAKTRKTPTGWYWTGATNRKGYGRLGRGGHDGPTILAHRAAWEVAYGPIPEGMDVLHHCDEPPCIKAIPDEYGPGHLFLGTDLENNRDMAAKGRHGNQKKTHCKHGHEYTAENTKPNSYGQGRRCRTCHNEDMRRRRAAT